MMELSLGTLTTTELAALDLDYPHARRILAGGLFISHSGRDVAQVRREVLPVVDPLFGISVFLHSKASGGSIRYAGLVRFALHLCSHFVLIVFQNVAEHPWVSAEVAWALTHDRQVIACRIDGTPMAAVDPRLPSAGRAVDLYADTRAGQTRLRKLLVACMGEPSTWPAARWPGMP